MAIERNFTGFEFADGSELNFGTGSVISGALNTFPSGTARSGSRHFRLDAATNAANLASFPAGSIVGTSGTVSSGNHKRVSVRAYFRIEAAGSNGQIRMIGFGNDAGTCTVWFGNENTSGGFLQAGNFIGLRIGSQTFNHNPGVSTPFGTVALSVGVWYRLLLDIDLDVSATTVLTASVRVTDDSDSPTVDFTVTNSANIGATDNIDKFALGYSNGTIGGFGRVATYNFDDIVYVATSDSDAVSGQPTLPTPTHIYAIVPPTGHALLSAGWTGTFADVDEYPLSGADTMSSSTSGGEVEFSHASGIALGYSQIEAMKLYVNALISGAGTGSVDYMLNGVAKNVTLGINYPSSLGTVDPIGGLLFSTLTPAGFAATTFGLKKQNGTQATVIGNIGVEVLGTLSAYGSGNQIRGETQIKRGSIYDAQIADSAAIARHKIVGLTDAISNPVFFPEEQAEEWMMVPGPAGAAAKASSQVVPVFFPDDLFDEMPMGAGGSNPSANSPSAINASAYRATNQTLTHNTEAALSLSNVDYDTSSLWASGSPTRLTCPAGGTGIYLVRATVKFGTGFQGTVALRIYKNGTLFTEETSAGLDLLSGSEYHQVSADVSLVPADYVEVKALVLLLAGSGTIDAVGGSGNTFVQAALLSPQIGQGDFVKIAQITTTGSQATVDFQNIPSNYSSIEIEWISRDTQGGTSVVGFDVTLNNDTTAANYTSVFRIGSQNAAAVVSNIASSTKGVQVGAHPQDGNTAGMAGTGKLLIVGYASTTWHKRILSNFGNDDATANGLTGQHTARWKSASAVNRVTFNTEGTAFKDGSIFTLYGRR